MTNELYIGRFAPSPTGPLHLGSLMSATCSYLQAKANNGKWLVRIEDVDTPRIVKGMASKQLQQLEGFGFEWDEQVLYQSTRIDAYNDIIQQLINSRHIYACECSRKQLKATAITSNIGLIYPKNCLTKNLDLSKHSLRLKTKDKNTCFTDRIYGSQNFNIQRLCSDWVIRRADKIIAYHLAVIADDELQGITEVVRGVDLLALTPIHIDLQTLLSFNTPKYFHHPLIVKGDEKLSKQNLAEPLNNKRKIHSLNIVLKALGQKPIVNSHNINNFWQQAIKQWRVTSITTNNFNYIE